MATILTFVTHDHPRTAPCGDTQAEVIVFPRTDIRALRRLSVAGAEPTLAADRAPEDRSERDPA